MASSSKQALQIPLPHTEKGPYPANFWKEFKKKLTLLQLEPSLDSLEQIILKNADMNLSETLPNLRRVLNGSDNTNTLIAFIASLALSSPDLLPEGYMPCLERQKLSKAKKQVEVSGAALFKRTVKLTRYQVASLLSLMFFCVIFPWTRKKNSHSGHFTGHRAPTGKHKPETFFPIN